jgi:NAD(P)-dependent dehydrogenase (short-subunit alcohol dehydrogenase family)
MAAAGEERGSEMAKWTAQDIPDLTGRAAIVTGANSGIGYQTAFELARCGAAVTLACRDQERGDAALRRLKAKAPTAVAEVALLDLADLAAIRRFAEAFQARQARLDLLINNAGLMAIPRRETVDGFEMQFGVNHLGHFALTGRLFPLLTARPGARIVTVSSNAHRPGRIDFDDLQHKQRYRPWAVYAQSKLANLLFAFELQRRSTAASLGVLSVAAHPGFAATNLADAGARMTGHPLRARFIHAAVRLLGQSDARGALPTLYAATAPAVTDGAFYGPDAFQQQRGYPKEVKAAPRAYDEATARRLWQVSEELTGVRFEQLDTAETRV